MIVTNINKNMLSKVRNWIRDLYHGYCDCYLDACGAVCYCRATCSQNIQELKAESKNCESLKNKKLNKGIEEVMFGCLNNLGLQNSNNCYNNFFGTVQNKESVQNKIIKFQE